MREKTEVQPVTGLHPPQSSSLRFPLPAFTSSSHAVVDFPPPPAAAAAAALNESSQAYQSSTGSNWPQWPFLADSVLCVCVSLLCGKKVHVTMCVSCVCNSDMIARDPDSPGGRLPLFVSQFRVLGICLGLRDMF